MFKTRQRFISSKDQHCHSFARRALPPFPVQCSSNIIFQTMTYIHKQCIYEWADTVLAVHWPSESFTQTSWEVSELYWNNWERVTILHMSHKISCQQRRVKIRIVCWSRCEAVFLIRGRTYQFVYSYEGQSGPGHRHDHQPSRKSGTLILGIKWPRNQKIPC
jgi:hypothetical protein